MITPRIPAGTLELLPREQIIFQHMLDVIRKGYESFGFVPIETPVFELKEVLLTKSGGETEKQVYFVQSTGSLQQGLEPELALRFDLTVPLARYVAQHERDLAFPFRRYQIQRVYRGERPQRGREREFYQCDIDIIGKDKLSSAYDAELPAVIVKVFADLKIPPFTINFSNRKILFGFLEHENITEEEKKKAILREIDKIEKIGFGRVKEGLKKIGINGKTIEGLLRLISVAADKSDIISFLKAQKIDNKTFQQGISELEQMIFFLKALGVAEERTKINLAIARGLDYYTGTVYETFINEHRDFGSICSGGRYENLASYYTKSKLPGVGVSIGITRLFDQLRSYNMLPEVRNTVQILITQMDSAFLENYLSLAAELRKAGFCVENYLEQTKLDKQIKYADKTGIPIVIIIGSDEIRSETVIVKKMEQKEQMKIPRSNLVSELRNFFR